MKKRLFSLLLAGMLVVGLVAGCGKKEESGEAKSGGDEGSEKLKVALVVNQNLATRLPWMTLPRGRIRRRKILAWR